jgi:hypothetical protein
MRLGAGHPAGPFEVLASLGPGRRSSLGLPGALPEAPASGPTAAPADEGWTGPVGVLGTGHMAGGVVEAVARSGRPVRVLARSEASGARLLGTLEKSLDRAVSRGRLDEAARAEVLGQVSVTTTRPTWPAPTSSSRPSPRTSPSRPPSSGRSMPPCRRHCRWRPTPRPSASATCARR